MPLPIGFDSFSAELQTLIPKELYEKILIEKDINVTDKSGQTAFIYLLNEENEELEKQKLKEKEGGVVEKGRESKDEEERSKIKKEVLQKMLGTLGEEGGIKFYPSPNKYNFTPLHFAVRYGYLDILRGLLDAVDAGKISQDEILLTDEEGNNVVHVAVYHKQSECLKELLKVKSLNEAAKLKNLYQETPLDIAIKRRDSDSLKLLKPVFQLSQDELKKLVIEIWDAYPEERYFDHDKINDGLRRYFEKRRKIEKEQVGEQLKVSDVIDEGQCLGLARFWGIFVRSGREEVFDSIMAAIANFDVTGKGFEQALPDLLQRKYPYENLRELFEQYKNAEQGIESVGCFDELIEKSKNKAEENQAVRDFFERIRKFEISNKAQITDIKSQIEVIKETLSIKEISEDSLDAVIAEQLKKHKEKGAILKKYEELKLLRAELVRLSREPEQELYKILSEKYELYKRLSPKEKEQDPFRGIMVELFEKYNDLEDLFEVVLPIIAILQYSARKAEELGHHNRLGQDSYKEVYELAIGVSPEVRLLSGRLDCDKDQIIEYLKFYAQFKNLFMDIGGSRHRVGFYVTPSGDIKYYDSNMRQDVFSKTEKNIFGSVEELVDHMIKLKYNKLGLLGPKKQIKFDALRFSDVQLSPKGPIILPDPLPEGSPNGFSLLHYKVMEYALLRHPKVRDELIKLCEDNPEALLIENKHEQSPLRMILELGDEELLSQKELIHAINVAIKDVDDDNMNVLMYAAGKKHNKAVSALIRTKIPIDEQNADGMTALMFAVRGENHDVVSLLLEARASVDLKDNWGRTVLMRAAEYRDITAVSKLLKAGAVVNEKDKEGKTALDYAVDPDIRKLLQEALKKAQEREVKVQAEPAGILFSYGSVLPSPSAPVVIDILQEANEFADPSMRKEKSEKFKQFKDKLGLHDSDTIEKIAGEEVTVKHSLDGKIETFNIKERYEEQLKTRLPSRPDA